MANFNALLGSSLWYQPQLAASQFLAGFPWFQEPWRGKTLLVSKVGFNINVLKRLQIKFCSNWKCLVEYSPLLWVCSPQQDHPRWTPLSPTCGSIKCHLHVFQLNVSIIQNFWWYFEGNLLCLSKWCSNFGSNLGIKFSKKVKYSATRIFPCFVALHSLH